MRGTEPVGEAPILAFASDAETIEQIGRIVPGGRRGADIYEGGPAEAARALDQGAMPTVVIVDISRGGPPPSASAGRRDRRAVGDQAGRAAP